MALNSGGPRETPPRSAFLFWLVFATFLLAITSGSGPVLLPRLVEEFSLRLSDAGVIGTAYGFGRLMVGVLLGAVVRRVSGIVLIFGSLGILALGLELMALAPNYSALVFGRFFTGVGFVGVLFIVILTILSRVVGAARVKAISVFELGLVSGMGIGAIASGALLTWLGWRGVLHGMVVLVAVAAGISRWAGAARVLTAFDRMPTQDRSGNFSVGPVASLQRILKRLFPAYLTSFCLAVFWGSQSHF